MEKISRIIPPSARTKNYDVARAQPGRPGAPMIGRPESMNVLDDRMTLSEQFLDPILNGETLPPTQTYKPTEKQQRENLKSQVVKEMTDKFFLKQSPRSVAKDSAQAQSEEIASRVQSSTGSSVNPDSSSDVSL